MLSIQTFEVTPFQQNARLVACDRTRHAVMIDPGGEAERLIAAVQAAQVELQAIWLTHSHVDHCGAVAALLRTFKVPLFAHPDEAFFRSHVIATASMYGLSPSEFEDCPEPDQTIRGGETLQVGEQQFQVLFTPGHAPGHVCFYNAAEKVLLAGDTLFAGSIGRTDLPGGNEATLLRSISDQILALPPETRVLPGHGPDTTVGHEKQYNPFLK